MRWLADENLAGAIVRGIRRRSPLFDVVRAQDIEAAAGKSDEILLEWATADNRIVVTHDVSTMLPAM